MGDLFREWQNGFANDRVGAPAQGGDLGYRRRVTTPMGEFEAQCLPLPSGRNGPVSCRLH